MRSRNLERLALSVLLLLPLTVIHSQATEGQPSDSPPAVEDLGDGRYRIGLIEVDATNKLLTVPGRVELGEQSLQSLAVAGAGFRGFESLLELDANAHEFQAACGLLGLTPDEGGLVSIRVSWVIGGETTTVDATELFQQGSGVPVEGGWIYTGSTDTPEGELLAHLDGTLIGLVPDPASLIQLEADLDGDDSAPLGPNLPLLPPNGTRMTLTIERP